MSYGNNRGGGGGGSHKDWDLQCKVYVGNLVNNVTPADLEESFSKYGAVRNIWVARNPPGFAFVEFEDKRDAEDACRNIDSTRVAGSRVKVEMSTGRTRRRGFSDPKRRSRSRSPHAGGGGGRRSGGGRGRSRSRSRSPRRRSRSKSYSPRR